MMMNVQCGLIVMEIIGENAKLEEFSEDQETKMIGTIRFMIDWELENGKFIRQPISDFIENGPIPEADLEGRCKKIIAGMALQ